ncbi:MAG: exonuclease SbcCD subunit D [Lachnospiraceae bacterium]|nr:exonuclease SbcCD subunit D [Lachnospiraceae bacterium]
MRFLHLSDLHIGKRVNEISMLDEQAYILDEILDIIDSQNPESILIAGDIYDKSVPQSEAVRLFDDFLTSMAQRNKSVFIISGNHDSSERLSFGSRIMKSRRIYISSIFEGSLKPVCLSDAFGEINIYMLPFVKPANVRDFFLDKKIETYNDALKAVMGTLKTDLSKRNVLIAHQFVTGAIRSDSEEISVGGLDNVDAEVFGCFDYVALGHIHTQQWVLKENIRYCGTPLKYSLSEAKQGKSVTILDLNEKGNFNITAVPLIPKHDMREIKGSYNELALLKNYKDTKTDDYIHITLTDENYVPDAIGKLSAIYPNIMKLDYDNLRTSREQNTFGAANIEEKLPLELFDELYYIQNNIKMDEEQKKLLSGIIEEVWEVGK